MQYIAKARKQCMPGAWGPYAVHGQSLVLAGTPRDYLLPQALPRVSQSEHFQMGEERWAPM